MADFIPKRGCTNASGGCFEAGACLFSCSAQRQAGPDCRTCARCYSTKGQGVYGCDSIVGCTNGDRYQPLPPVRLWRNA